LATLQSAIACIVRRADEQLKKLNTLADRLLRGIPHTAVMGELLDLDLDVVPVTPSSEFRLAGVYGFGRGLFDRGLLQGGDTSYPRLHRLRAGQVVLSRLKAFEGAVAVVPPEFDGWVFSPEFPTFSPRNDAIHPHYLAMLCEWPGLRELMQKASRGIGARRERVSAEAFLNLIVPLPDCERQRQLGVLYTRIQAIRRIDKRRRELLDRLTASALNHAFAGLA
jgi:type I restriction enzyme S subunit